MNVYCVYNSRPSKEWEREKKKVSECYGKKKVEERKLNKSNFASLETFSHCCLNATPLTSSRANGRQNKWEERKEEKMKQ